MNDLLLKGAIALDSARNKVTDLYASRNERGDIVQTIIIIAMFVLICVVVGTILYDAIFSQAETVGDCITNVNSGACTDFRER